MKHLLIILSFLLLSSPVFGQSERPETIIIPVSGIGEIPNSRKLILQNKLTNKLKQYFRIVPQEKYEQVLEQVFEELEYEECSEDTCIMRVQEMLQVENVFNLQVIGEGDDTQLNLEWITLDEKKNEEDYCKGCGTFELRKMIGGLVEKLVNNQVNEKPIIVVEEKENGNSEKIKNYIEEDSDYNIRANKLREFKEDKSCHGFSYDDYCINDWVFCAYYLEGEPMMKCINKLYEGD